ncbi:alpha-L-rhamnosidase C-terminal domain-containing protein [Cerasicoccus frondis]|uniref:alpha-L-rhamnosidase-related protein n=1 Tax=Cerasicoccus frondis TaxID=490090 RepID=UPI002852C03F|nr:alpha-L-rhamnosidase C-terminal domain-containing protein [Cerasicoccus frondis]
MLILLADRKVMTATKIILSPGNPDAAGVHQQYPIETAEWIWGDVQGNSPIVARLKLDFEVGQECAPILIHVSADQRYELYLDDELISCGPEACDVAHWSFSSFEIKPTSGKHRFMAVVWSLGEHAPEAHSALRPGFILAAEGPWASLLNTGAAEWKWAEIAGYEFTKQRNLPGAHLVGSAVASDLVKTCAEPERWATAVVSEPQVQGWGWEWGLRFSERVMHPAVLPEQKRQIVRSGGIRAIWHVDVGLAGDVSKVPEGALDDAEIDLWNELIHASRPLQIPANTQVAVLWDLGEYFCGYAFAEISQGEGANLAIEWAEALYDERQSEGDMIRSSKGNRNEINQKYFYGFGDACIADGGLNRKWGNLWWRSGRYLLMRIQTAEKELTLNDWYISSTGMPLDFKSDFTSTSTAYDDLFQLCRRGIESCAHETFVDCPYYEQMLYFGDTRVQALCVYVTVGDASLQRKALLLGDWSRSGQGGYFTAGRYPSNMPSSLPTFSLIWVAMIRDHLDWRGEVDFVRSLLPGMRIVIDRFELYRNAGGLVSGLPGWQFVDWCATWDNGVPPGALAGCSSVINLLYAWALRQAAYVERSVGSAARAEALDEICDDLLKLVIDRFWSDDRKLMADDAERSSYSQHAQILALLAGGLDEGQQSGALHGLKYDQELHQTAVYFRHYLFQVAFQCDAPELCFDNLSDWFGMLEAGARTPWERPEPSRSDCHAWGSHPWFWGFAGIAGIQPAAPGFSKVHIKPQPGLLKDMNVSVTHPQGEIRLNLEFKDGQCVGSVQLPGETSGAFIWGKTQLSLAPGENQIDVFD